MRKWLPFFEAMILLSVSVSGRAQISDSLLYAAGVRNATGIYEQQLKDQLPLLNGTVYVEYPYTFTSGTPFFPPGHFASGNVTYDDVVYTNIPLVYDLLSGDVIAELTLNIRLIPGKIGSFSILDHRFVRLPDTLLAGSAGFYEWLAAGRVNLYKKVRKKLDVKRARLGTDVYAAVVETISYLLEKDGRIFSVDNRSQLLARLKDKSQAIDAFIKFNRLALAPDNYEYGLLKVIAFYNGNNDK